MGWIVSSTGLTWITSIIAYYPHFLILSLVFWMTGIITINSFFRRSPGITRIQTTATSMTCFASFNANLAKFFNVGVRGLDFIRSKSEPKDSAWYFKESTSIQPWTSVAKFLWNGGPKQELHPSSSHYVRKQLPEICRYLFARNFCKQSVRRSIF